MDFFPGIIVSYAIFSENTSALFFVKHCTLLVIHFVFQHGIISVTTTLAGEITYFQEGNKLWRAMFIKNATFKFTSLY